MKEKEKEKEKKTATERKRDTLIERISKNGFLVNKINKQNSLHVGNN